MSLYKYEIQFEVFPDPNILKNIDQRSWETFSLTPFFEPKGNQAVVVDEYGFLCLTDKNQAKGLRKIYYYIDISNPENLENFNEFYNLISLNFSEEEVRKWSLKLESPNEEPERLGVIPFKEDDYKFFLSNIRVLCFELKSDRILNLFLSSFMRTDYELDIKDKFIVKIEIDKFPKGFMNPRAIQIFFQIPQFNPPPGKVAVMDEKGFLITRNETDAIGLHTRTFVLDLSGQLSLMCFNQIPDLPRLTTIKNEWFLPLFEKRKNGCIDKLVLVQNNKGQPRLAFSDAMEKIDECRDIVESIKNDPQIIAYNQNLDLFDEETD